MQKIIAAFDGLKYAISTEQAAIQLAKQTGNHLTAVFLEDFTYTSYKIHDLIQKNNLSEKKLRAYSEKDIQTRDKSVAAFELACRKAGIPYNIHRNKNICMQELLHESLYADLLVIDQKESFSHYNQKIPTPFIREMLGDVQCPVLLVNDTYVAPQKLVLLYDGAPASVQAVKMFSYLLPTMAQLPTEVISAKGYYGDLHVPDNRLMKEFMKRHYPKATYTVLTGHIETEIVNRLKKEKLPSLIVLGDNRRSTVSRWFKQSMDDILMKELPAAIFIAHNK